MNYHHLRVPIASAATIIKQEGKKKKNSKYQCWRNKINDKKAYPTQNKFDCKERIQTWTNLMLNHSQTSTSVESFAHSKDTQAIHNPRKIFPSNLKHKPRELHV